MNSTNLSIAVLSLFVRRMAERVGRSSRTTVLFAALLILPLLVFGQSDPISFAVIGDYGHAGSGERDVSNLVHGWNPDFVITTGDNNYPDGKASTIDANIGQYYHDFIFPYVGTYGTGATSIRFFPSLGNHDWHTADAQPYVDYFVLPGNERYYDFVRGSVHFFAIDSDGAEPDGNTETSVQGNWLKNKLLSATEPWKIVYFHHPPYSSSHHGPTRVMQWHFKEWGASAVLSGHDHTYERLNVNGLPYFVNGLGGAERYDFETILSTSQFRYNATYGAMLVDADSDSITFKFYNTAGTLIDTFTLSTSNPGGIAAPNGLVAQAVSASQINLTWNDNSNNESGFDIERCAAVNCTSFARIAQVGADVENYSDPTITAGAYRYRVRAFNASAASAFSNIASVSTSAPSGALTDDFNDGVIDLSKWTVGMFSRAVSYVDPRLAVSEQNGKLNIDLNELTDGTHYNGIKSANSWDMTGASAVVEVADASDNKAVTIFAVGIDKNNWLAFRAKGGSLYVEQRVDAVTSNDQLSYDKIADRFWRIRHDPAADTIVFETSADANAWVVKSTVPRPFPQNAVRFELSAGTSDAINKPGIASFDNFRFGPN